MLTHALTIIGLMLTAWAWPHIVRAIVLTVGNMMNKHEQP